MPRGNAGKMSLSLSILSLFLLVLGVFRSGRLENWWREMGKNEWR